MLDYQGIYVKIANKVHLPISSYSVEKPNLVKPNHLVHLKISKMICYLMKFLIMITNFQGFWDQSELTYFGGKIATIEYQSSMKIEADSCEKMKMKNIKLFNFLIWGTQKGFLIRKIKNCSKNFDLGHKGP